MLARENITMVYGGGNVGLIGIAADAALSAGGTVIGVIPEALVKKEVAHRGLTELRVVKSIFSWSEWCEIAFFDKSSSLN